jgi:hypothetical protein
MPRPLPSLHHEEDRHGLVDTRAGHYLCFPDVALADTGELVAVYREADRHVAGRSKLLVRRSADLGASWTDPLILHADGGHCPRITRLAGGELVVVDDNPPMLVWSADHGRTWTRHAARGLDHGIPDRLLAPDPDEPDTLLTAAHAQRGSHPQPAIGQPWPEQMLYRSENRGRTWQAVSPISHAFHLSLCEASLVRLEDGRLLALMRENSHVHEPMYACLSDDQGRTWSEPRPTPLIGHRPCLGLTRSGRLLVTWRNTGPDPGTSAWLGAPEELVPGPDAPDPCMVHGLVRHLPDEPGPQITPDGLLLECSGGHASCARYCLRPLTDPARASAALEADVHVMEGGRNHFGLRLGVWWRIEAGRITPELEGARPLKLPPDRLNRIRIEYEQGRLTLRVNGRKRRSWEVEADSVSRRAVLVGNAHPAEENAGRSLLAGLRLETVEPRYGRACAYRWSPEDGPPDARARSRVLELRNGGAAAWPDFGYSGWVETAPGEFFCVYHHADGNGAAYLPGRVSHVAATRFSEVDFGQ